MCSSDLLAGLSGVPAGVQARLFQAFGIELVYNKPAHQVTIYATITPSTPQALAAVIADSEPPTIPTTPAGLGHSPQHPRRAADSHPRGLGGCRGELGAGWRVPRRLGWRLWG